jgi:hypothetical protein
MKTTSPKSPHSTSRIHPVIRLHPVIPAFGLDASLQRLAGISKLWGGR